MNRKQQDHKARRDAAMPEVKRLVKKFGRSVVSGCLARIRDYEKSQKRLADLKREMAQLEKRL